MKEYFVSAPLTTLEKSIEYGLEYWQNHLLLNTSIRRGVPAGDSVVAKPKRCLSGVNLGRFSVVAGNRFGWRSERSWGWGAGSLSLFTVVFGYGTHNKEAEDILKTCATADLAIGNTFFKTKPEHLITYSSEGHATQIDFCLLGDTLLAK